MIGSAQHYTRPLGGPCSEHGHWLAQTGPTTMACDLCDFEGIVVNRESAIEVSVPLEGAWLVVDGKVSKAVKTDIAGHFPMYIPKDYVGNSDDAA
jgi:hypothetical protein